ncbi:ZKSC2 protein, partial [Alopecoenas beccarii]|nr:ZKSC2 protein [Alopecoenas beccarii]
TLRWTVVQQLEPPAGKSAGSFPPFKSIIVLQKSYECGECGKSFSCRSHFGKHRRTHTG